MHLTEDEIVISGVGGYFPKCTNIEQLKDKLFANESLVDVRWKQCEGNVNNVAGGVETRFYDNAFFGTHRAQCLFMDPMQRMVLERSFEALIDAGVNPAEIRGKRVGCFIGSSIGENDNAFLESVISGFGVTGHSRAMLPNRISYWLNLKGPSVAYDSNWVNGISVLKLAFDSIRSGQCESAIIGTANLVLNPELQYLYSGMGLVSPDGVTRPFDADANGYVRSDGVVVLYIQKASNAKRSYATVVNVDAMFNGDRPGNVIDLDVPTMINFLDNFYKNIPIRPEEVDFIEAYGSGFKTTDIKELKTLEAVYCKNRKYPLLVGSVKPNTGHSEASSTLFSIVKVLIAMENAKIPATLNYKTPNPEIPALTNGKIKVVDENTEWNGQYAAVNGIGLNSYYGHVLLKSNSKTKRSETENLPSLIIASTRTEEGIKQILETVKAAPKDPEYYHLIQEFFSTPVPGHLYRGYSVLGEEIKQEADHHAGNKRQVWFVYSGMGSQWQGMASDLMKLPIFAESIHKSHKVLEPKGIDLINIITTTDEAIFDSILHSFVGIAAIQIALTDVLRAIGISPDGIIGHSVGELGCAYADGCLTAEQMILAAYSRGKASLEAELIKGMMAAIGMGYQQIKDKVPPTIEVACHNGPDSSTISGPTEDMEKFVKELQDQGIFARLVNVANIAYHSRYIKPAAPTLLKYLKEVIPVPVPRSSKWISTSNVEEKWDTDLAKTSSAEYHTNNLLSAVLFEEGLKHIPKDSVLIEIAPHGLLQAILKRSLKTGFTNVSLTQRRSKSGLEFLLGSLGKLYLAGLDFKISALYPKVEYPVSRGTNFLAPLAHWNHTDVWRSGMEDKLQNLHGIQDIQVTLNSESFRDCIGHQLDDKIILPTSYYLNIIYNMMTQVHPGIKDIIFENLHFKQHLCIPKNGSVPINVHLNVGSGYFEIVSNLNILMSGNALEPQPTDKLLADPIDVEIVEENIQLSGSDFYNELKHRGYKYSGQFKTLKSLTIAEEGSVGLIQWNDKWTMLLEAMLQQQILQDGEKLQEIFVPKTIQRIVISFSALPEEKKDMKTVYHYSTGTVYTEAIQITDLKTIVYPKEQRPIFYDSLEIVPLNNIVYPDIERGLNTALQLAIDNFPDQYITYVTVVELVGRNSSLIPKMKNLLQQFTRLHPNIITAKEVNQIQVQQNYPLLILSNDYLTEELVAYTASTCAFSVVRTDKSLLSYSQVVQVGQFTHEGVSYSIIRKANNIAPLVVLAKSDTLSIKDLTRSSLNWVTELNAAVQTAKAKHQSVFLVSSLVPTEGYSNFVQELRQQPNMSPVRVIFTPERRLNDFNTEDILSQRIFKQDLGQVVIKEGGFYSYLPVPVKYKEDVKILNITSNVIKNKTLSYLGVNLKDLTLNPLVPKPNELGCFDYTGVNNSGQNIMGIATLDKTSYKLIPDEILSWNVPDNIELDDACTLPFAYVSAFYALVIKGKLEPGETVLIHGGCTPVGFAAIAIAHCYKCTVYTSIATDWQKNYLKKQFNFLRDQHILPSNSSNFEPLFMLATGGLGASVVLNILSGSLLQTSFNCVGKYGRFLQIGKYDLEENNRIGMNIFLNNVDFISIDLNNVVNQPQEVKQEIRDLINKGIQTWMLKPMTCKIVNHQNYENILNELKKPSSIGKIIVKINSGLSLSKFNVQKPNQFICDNKSSYLIYGGNSETWCDMAEWLILHGARKLIIASESKAQQTHLLRRVTLLQNYYGAEIIMAQTKSHTREGAAELLSEVYLLGPIHGIFLLPGKNSISRTSDYKPVQYLDLALRTTAPKALFVNFISAAAGICQLRSEAGFYTYNIQWLKDQDFNDALNGLDDILNMKVKNVLVKNEKINDNSKQESTPLLIKKLSMMLPESIEQISTEIKLGPKEPTLIQLESGSIRDIRELAPVFVIPGINGQKEILDLAKELLYPTYCAVLPTTNISIKDTAVDLVGKILEIYPSGPFNIVGVSWGGALAIEVAKLLEQQKKSVHIFFIDSAPHSLQSALKHLGEDDVQREINLLTKILSINDNQVVSKMEQAESWEARIKLAFDNYEGELKDKLYLQKGLSLTKYRLQGLASYHHNEDLISGQSHLVRPEDCSKYDNCGLTSYLKHTPDIVLVDGDHISIINSKNTAEYINKMHYMI